MRKTKASVNRNGNLDFTDADSFKICVESELFNVEIPA